MKKLKDLLNKVNNTLLFPMLHRYDVWLKNKQQKGSCPAGCDCFVDLISNPNTGNLDIFYCKKCGMYFWYNYEHETFQKREEEIWANYINESLYLYINKHTEVSIQIKIQKIFNYIKNMFYKFLRERVLLTEKCYFKRQNYKYTLHVDSKESNHNIPHVHFYYGSGTIKEVQRIELMICL